MIDFQKIKQYIYTNRTQSIGIEQSSTEKPSSMKMTPPIDSDRFELRTSATEEVTALSEYELIKNGCYLELFACKKYGINFKEFNSIDELHNYFKEKLKEYEEYSIDSYQKYDTIEEQSAEFLKHAKLSKLQNVIRNINCEESDPVKKFIFCNEYLSPSNNDVSIMPYQKEIADEVFNGIVTTVKANPRRTFRMPMYDTYKQTLLNSDKMTLFTRKRAKEISINNKNGEIIGTTCLSDKGYIYNLGIHELYRHSKVSKRTLNMMFQKAEEIAEENGLKKLILDVGLTNSRAAKGYIKKQGFQTVNFDILKYEQRMEKPLRKGVINEMEEKERQQGTELFYEYSCFDNETQNLIKDAIINNCISQLNDKEKAFVEKYKDFKEHQIFKFRKIESSYALM